MNGLILLNCEQGSEAWHQARLGIPTASQFDRIVTASGTASKQATGYLAELLAEHITGQTGDNYQSADMQRGVELDPPPAPATNSKPAMTLSRSVVCTSTKAEPSWPHRTG